jgi:hypothetical protein
MRAGPSARWVETPAPGSGAIAPCSPAARRYRSSPASRRNSQGPCAYSPVRCTSVPGRSEGLRPIPRPQRRKRSGCRGGSSCAAILVGRSEPARRRKIFVTPIARGAVQFRIGRGYRKPRFHRAATPRVKADCENPRVMARACRIARRSVGRRTRRLKRSGQSVWRACARASRGAVRGRDHVGNEQSCIRISPPRTTPPHRIPRDSS